MSNENNRKGLRTTANLLSVQVATGAAMVTRQMVARGVEDAYDLGRENALTMFEALTRNVVGMSMETFMADYRSLL